MKRKAYQEGYTLTEAMIVAAIIGVVCMITPTLFAQTVRFYLLHNAKVEIQRDARVTLDIVNRFLRQARSSTVNIDQVSGQPPYSRINFTMLDGQRMTFYQSGTTLYQVGRSTTSISKNLQYLAFTYPRSDDPTIMSVALTMSKGTFQGRTKALELSIEKVRIMN